MEKNTENYFVHGQYRDDAYRVLARLPTMPENDLVLMAVGMTCSRDQM